MPEDQMFLHYLSITFAVLNRPKPINLRHSILFRNSIMTNSNIDIFTGFQTKHQTIVVQIFDNQKHSHEHARSTDKKKCYAFSNPLCACICLYENGQRL